MAEETFVPDLSTTSGSVPIKNLYYLLCYAWNHFREGNLISTSGVDAPTIVDLLGNVLINGTRHLLRRGIDRGYVTHDEDTSRIRGRIGLKETLQRPLVIHAKAHCEFDELTSDILHNQILKTTISRLSKTQPLDEHLRHELKQLTHDLLEISTIRLSQLSFRKLQL